MLKKPLYCFLILIILTTCSSWGFFAHQKINQLAVFILPGDLIRFYKNNIQYITEHAVDADKRRYVDSAEAARHYIDLEHYGSHPFDSVPKKWQAAANKYSAEILIKNGIVPWQIERSYFALRKAFHERDSARILRLSADLGHYISDAHVPLHTTENYNGQLTGQHGIHGFWESRLPELFHQDYSFIVGRVSYIENPLASAWDIVAQANSMKDSVLSIEKKLSIQFRSDHKYNYSERNGIVIRQYSPAYSKAYHQNLNGMVERQMRSSIKMTANFWYSAWVDAGQPKLTDFNTIPDSSNLNFLKRVEKLFRSGKIIGRDEG